LVAGIASFVMCLSACVTDAPPDVEPAALEVGVNEEELARRPGPMCGCEDGGNDDCRDVPVYQRACNYGAHCNYTVYKPDCSAANPCPLTTWNGCPLVSTWCALTGMRCDGSCSDGRACTIRYGRAPVEPILESNAEPDDDAEPL
jgi:hypothetical protein